MVLQTCLWFLQSREQCLTYECTDGHQRLFSELVQFFAYCENVLDTCKPFLLALYETIISLLVSKEWVIVVMVDAMAV